MASNPRLSDSLPPTSKQDQSNFDRESLKTHALNRLYESKRDDEQDSGSDHKDSTDKIPRITMPTLPSRLLKPVFIAPKAVPAVSSEERDLYESEERIADTKSLFHSIMAVEGSKRSRTFEEKRIEGTVFDMNSVDDTDGIDEDIEKERWQEREMLRIKWELEQQNILDQVQHQAERQDMTEEERQEQDREKEKEWTEKAEVEHGEYKFLQKYYHKGSFFHDSNDPLFRRNYSAATGADSGVSRDSLPAVLQVRNFGKKGRSKWTHLSAEDTTSFDYGWGDKKNQINYEPINKMGGMRGDLENPSKRRKR